MSIPDDRPRPNLFIVGAPKCGTTWLYRALGQHPDVFMSAVKQPRFWSEDLRAEGRAFHASHLRRHRQSWRGLLTLPDCLWRHRRVRPERLLGIETMGLRAVNVSDCYAACRIDASRIAFLPYVNFPLVAWDVVSFDHHVSWPPRGVHGSHALSMFSKGALFFSPYDRKGAIVSWQPGGEASVVARRDGRLRGLPGGNFLTHGPNSFTVVSCGPPGLWLEHRHDAQPGSDV